MAAKSTNLDDPNYSSHIKQKLMRSNTLLLKLTFMVNNLGSKAQRLEEEYFTLEMKYHYVLDQLTRVEEELHSSDIKLQDMEHNIAAKEKEVTSLKLQLDVNEQHLIAKDHQVRNLQEESKHFNSLFKFHMKEVLESGAQKTKLKGSHEHENTRIMKQQLAEFVSYKEKNDDLLNKVSSLEESLSIKNQHLHKLQLKLYDATKENEHYTSGMEKITSELGEIETQLESFLKWNKTKYYSTGKKDDPYKTLFLCNKFAWINTQDVQARLSREQKIYNKKVEQVSAIQKDLCQCQTRLEHRLLKNRCLEELLFEAKLIQMD